MEAVIYLFLILTSEEVVEPLKISALFFCGSYLIAQAVMGISAYEERKATEHLLEEMKAKREANAQQIGMQKSIPIPQKETMASPAAEHTTYLTDEQRALGKKLIEQMRGGGKG